LSRSNDVIPGPAIPASHGLPYGKALRLHRLFRNASGNAFILPMDHSVSDGPIMAAGDVDRMVGVAAESGVDGVVLHKGRVQSVAPHRWQRLCLILHLSASTKHAADPDAKVLVSSLDDALRLGADAVSLHVNVGSDTEREQLVDLGRVASLAAAWNLPVLAMMYPRGRAIRDPGDPELVAHAANLAADLGADVAKVPYTGSATSMRDVVRQCPIPVVAAGGPRRASMDDLLSDLADMLAAGVRGVALGRNVWGADDPGLVARRVAGVVHGRIARAAGV
jgi:2-amino-4,5-dihydroxy-6-oxo-7-(phosphooxy)heptanoate synthase